MEEEELEISPELKKMLVSELDLIRDTISIAMLFIEGPVKTGLEFLDGIQNEEEK